MVPKIVTASVAFLLFLGAGTVGCRGPRARSERSFDEIQALAHGKTADQILHLLGEPDSRRVVLDADERWIWWNYTFLDGNDCPPEMRGRVVHLEILVRNPERTQAGRRPYSEWQVDDILGITYRAPFTDG
jgi:hypothetical protein